PRRLRVRYPSPPRPPTPRARHGRAKRHAPSGPIARLAQRPKRSGRCAALARATARARATHRPARSREWAGAAPVPCPRLRSGRLQASPSPTEPRPQPPPSWATPAGPPQLAYVRGSTAAGRRRTTVPKTPPIVSPQELVVRYLRGDLNDAELRAAVHLATVDATEAAAAGGADER